MSGDRPEAPRLPPEITDAVPCPFALLSESGRLVETNARWDEAVATNALPADDGGVYLDVLAAANGDLQAVVDAVESLSTIEEGVATAEIEVDGRTVRAVSFVPVGERSRLVALLLLTEGIAEQVFRVKERAMDEAPVGITITNPHLPDNPIVYANESFERITGYPNEEAVGRNCRFLQGPDTDADTVTEIREAIEAEEPVTVVVENYTRDGERFWNELTIAPLYDDGDLTHYVGFQQDVTERITAKQELETQRDQFAVLNQVVRHDIRNDMSVVLGWGEQLRAQVDDEDARESLERILNAATHTKNLTTAVRDFAEALSTDSVSLATVSLSGALSEEVDRVRSTFDNRSESVTVEMDDVPSEATVMANDLLSSVFGNVLDNAVYHNDRDDVRIRVSVEEREDTYVVRIADNGPGITDERKREVFGRGDRGLESAGTGLGLYLVDYLVDSYGGSVWLEDNEPRGTVVGIELQNAGEKES